MKKPFVMVAPTGARHTKAEHPEIPISIGEIVETTKSCISAGADALHLHVRDKAGKHSLDAGLYNEALSELSLELPDLPVQITTEAVGVFSVKEQLDCLAAVKPKWASMSIREICRDPALAPKVYKACEEHDITVQHILYDESDAQLLQRSLDSGIVLEDQRSVILVLGRYTKDQNSNPNDIVPFVKSLPDVTEWMVCAFGPNEHICLVEAARLGGNCRVGFENSRQNASGDIWASNEASVAALCGQFHEMEK